MKNKNVSKSISELHLFDIIIIVLSLYVLIALAITSIFRLPEETMRLMDIIDNCICIVFIIDFIIGFVKADKKWKFMRWGWIDLISSISSISILRYGRLFRLIRLLRILRAFRSTEILVRYIFKSKIKGTMLSVGIITILLTIFSSISILSVENRPDSNIKTAEDAIWWTMTTITTVGYGDRYPVTTEGRLIGIVLMVSGVGLFGTYTAYIASLFIGEEKKENDDKDYDE